MFQVGRGVGGGGGGDSWMGGGAHVSDPTEGWNSQGYTHTPGNTFYLVLCINELYIYVFNVPHGTEGTN